MGEHIREFEQLEAWQTARELVRFVYGAFRRAPASRDFGLRDQVQRAAVSVMTNIAEGFERIHTLEKLQFYNIARGSCGEVRSLSYVMLDAAYLTVEEHQKMMAFVAQTGRLVPGLIRTTQRRTASA
jgi:four helix bundle protein